ncbi:exodeoxyribonuclease VII large subunit [Rhodococcus sp. BP-349]|uniref:exodeoxyribonuclease VII large subunit n=1 Tax=unclassified Rhodococcus (in: high G+C Gram-positive bacteria) TaxID=192944 RepID=UPI001C9B5500|nr:MULTISPECIES: exodeoxyribonuclease VII large subunit [unclassified Rhodococcus (in: high G+C Gram-positive bacteria)]MBY6538595.1 exodeoxyribonuclease VII large subunit [Rhodococcus sp. BP-363]MBY6542932.1 exodeoxyribonuclease VII large subunit [Rhodococcus sp. BP-369]MBY6562162.1 exodeoxyribonuclease VII large subunit [Rhodococcus sp. BP-370]MBY6576454.1 exodeoxyribonuclease VII large subunit [Rhodococcus sp. BP-364]MBY6585755.1 exodeoxyribonuclease VII large subunit [Rhodococcus sp. BP-35
MTTAATSTAENPLPVRTVATKVAGWIDRLGSVWVEGQITQISVRAGTRTAFLTLRDPSADMSLSVTCSPMLIQNSPVPLTEGARVILYGKLSFFTGRGTLSLRATEIRAVGVGELLARIERLRGLLAAEGLFDPRLKRPLPFLPRVVGLVTARASAAERDVLSVAERRWPAVRFEVRNTPVQGPSAVPGILRALAELDEDPTVDVVILARGGGSVEDLLPFSDEALCRAISRATTPIVSAIGHEPDSPLSDHVADLRAATPTDAAKIVVPDAVAERELVTELRSRSAAALRSWVQREARALDALRHRPVLADPLSAVARREEEIAEMRRVVRRDVERAVSREATTVEHMRARLTTLGPAATLARGYSVVQRMVPGSDPEVLRSVDDAAPGTQLRVRVADGVVTAVTMGRSSAT